LKKIISDKDEQVRENVSNNPNFKNSTNLVRCKEHARCLLNCP
jgi:hypothetical protein